MLSEALRLIRVFNDVSQTKLAKRLGLSNSYLSELESGKKTPTLDVLQKYSNEFGIPVSSIMFFSENLYDNKPAEEVRSFISSKVLSMLKMIELKTE